MDTPTRREALLLQHGRELAELGREENRAANINRATSDTCDCCGGTDAAPLVVFRGDQGRALVICGECRQYGSDL